MQVVWLLFKFIEFVLGAICLGLHVNGVGDELEPMPHIVFYCGTFFGFTLIAIIGVLSILLRRPTTPIVEVIVNALGALAFIIASVVGMYHAEIDFHLMYLSDFEEPNHPFFRNCKQQSIASLSAGLVYLLHCIFAVDMACVKGHGMVDAKNAEAVKPMRLYFICKPIHRKLEDIRWFRIYADMDSQLQPAEEPHRKEGINDDPMSQMKKDSFFSVHNDGHKMDLVPDTRRYSAGREQKPIQTVVTIHHQNTTGEESGNTSSVQNTDYIDV